MTNKKKLDSKALTLLCEKSKKRVVQVGEDKVLICMGGGCIASGAQEVKDALQKALDGEKLSKKVSLIDAGCLGPCARGPVVVIGKDKTFYQKVTPEDAKTIVQSHIRDNKIVESLLWQDEGTEKPVPVQMDLEFFKRQTKVVLRNCGRIDPVSIEDYFGCDGYQALSKALTKMSPDGIIEEMKASGLRGRGGAGFPTWKKWSFTRASEGDTKYILCNADEGDPGAFMDRSVLEGDPHSLIEGMALGAFAIGASQGYVYVRAEYPLAVERLEIAIKQATEYGLLGDNILGTDFSFNLEIRMGSGAFVCGEETALIASIEGKRGEPRPRPPFPAQKGVWDKPTVLNNVETYANVAAIVLNGGKWFADFGTEKSKGTKVFALAGAIENAGLVEVPVGTVLGELIYDIGGGIPNGKEFKAAQIGGPSGGCIPKQHLNVPLDYESLDTLGAIMGSGGLIVMDDDTCMVDVARFFLDFVQEESCGKCVPCRVGTKRMFEILTRICKGEGREGDIEMLIKLGNEIKDTALCGLGQTAPNPVLSTIRYFRDEYEAHIKEKRCPAGVCADLVRAPCQNACPAGVDVPGFVSLVGEKRYSEALLLHRERNPLAAICASVCFHPCEGKCRRVDLDSPVSVRGIKRFMTDQEKEMLVPEVKDNPELAKRKIAVIGAGPSGLSCAYFLARMGYKPVIFEAEDKAGGMLVQTIPSYRLPRERLDKEIEMIKKMGVEIKTNTRLGKDITVEQLKQEGYEALYLAVGAPSGMNLSIKNSDAKGVVDGIKFLREFNVKGKTAVGKKVAIIGGGNVAIDVARTAVRLGAETVTVVYRRTKEEMPAYEEEIREAINEGVLFEFLAAPKEIEVKDGNAVGLRCSRMSLGAFDSSGRKKPVEEYGGEFVVAADQIVAAIGQVVEAKDYADTKELALTKKEYVQTDPTTQQSSVEWIFAGGDVVTGPSSVIDAIAAGEQAAMGIDTFLTKESHVFWREEKANDTDFDPDADPVEFKREELAQVAADKRKDSFCEVEQSWSESVAVKQAKRCLRCDYRETVECK